MKRVVGVVVVAGAVGLLGAMALAGPGQTTTYKQDITQPDHWVPLTAEYEMVRFNPQNPENPTTHKYILHRASDGSTRVEMLDPNVRPSIQIDNVPARKHFIAHADRWIEQPLRSQRNNGLPFSKLDPDDVQLVDRGDPRVRAAANAGCNSYEFRTTSWIVCPELNMLDVWQSTTDSSQRLMAVSLGEPDVEFSPPFGAVPEVRSEPGGRGSLTPEERQRLLERARQRARQR